MLSAFTEALNTTWVFFKTVVTVYWHVNMFVWFIKFHHLSDDGRGVIYISFHIFLFDGLVKMLCARSGLQNRKGISRISKSCLLIGFWTVVPPFGLGFLLNPGCCRHPIPFFLSSEDEWARLLHGRIVFGFLLRPCINHDYTWCINCRTCVCYSFPKVASFTRIESPLPNILNQASKWIRGQRPVY